MAGLKEIIGKKVLKKKLKSFQREIHVHNFETARSAVILFDTENPGDFQAIKAFGEFLKQKGIQSSAFGYVRQKEIPAEMLFWKNFSFITKNDLNWHLKPTGEVAEAFFAMEPDMLIDFTADLPLELQYLVQLSPAKFKISRFTEQENDYDLMINLTERSDTAYLVEQIKHYLSILTPMSPTET